MYWDCLGLSLLTGIDQKSGLNLYRWPLTQVPLYVFLSSLLINLDVLQETEAVAKAEAELEKLRKDRAEGDPVPLVKSEPVSVGRGVEIRLGGGESDDSDDLAANMEGMCWTWQYFNEGLKIFGNLCYVWVTERVSVTYRLLLNCSWYENLLAQLSEASAKPVT